MMKNMNEQQKKYLQEESGLEIVNKIRYLGIQTTMKNINLFEENYNKLWKQIKKDLEIWHRLKLSFWGKISAIKMNILPKILFLFQMIPVIGEMECFEKWRRNLLKFI